MAVRGAPKYADFLQDMRRGLVGVYVLTGNDEFLKREALRRLTETLVPAEARQFNCESFLAAEVAWKDVEAACLSAPLFADRRVVALIGIELMGQTDTAGLVAYARRPSSTTCLVAMTSGAGDEGRRRNAEGLARAASGAGKGAAVYSFWAGNARDCRAWSRAWLRDRGRSMSDGLLQQLCETYANSAYEVWNVMEKASSVAGDRKEITEADVASVGGAASLGSGPELRRVVACGDAAAAHVAVARCLQAGSQPTVLLWFLNRAFRHALKNVEEGRPANDGAKGRKELRWPESRDVEEITTRFDKAGLSRAISLIYETERGIKTGALDPALALDALINELTVHRSVSYRHTPEE